MLKWLENFEIFVTLGIKKIYRRYCFRQVGFDVRGNYGIFDFRRAKTLKTLPSLRKNSVTEILRQNVLYRILKFTADIHRPIPLRTSILTNLYNLPPYSS